MSPDELERWLANLPADGISTAREAEILAAINAPVAARHGGWAWLGVACACLLGYLAGRFTPDRAADPPPVELRLEQPLFAASTAVDSRSLTDWKILKTRVNGDER